MTYRPDVDGYIWVEHSRLAKITPPEHWDDESFNVLFKCIMAFCDRESPFLGTRVFEKRWEEIFRCFEVKKGSPVHTEIKQEGDVFQALMFTYFTILNDIDYQLWMSLKMSYDQLASYLRAPIHGAKDVEKAIRVKNAIVKDLGPLSEQIQAIEIRIFKDEYLQKLVAAKTAEDNLAGWAEKFAETPQWMSQN